VKETVNLGTYPVVYDRESIRRIAETIERDAKLALGLLPEDRLIVVDADVRVRGDRD